MSDIQLRWLVKEYEKPAEVNFDSGMITAVGEETVLQFRTSNSNGIHWSEWRDVPTVRESQLPSEE